MLNQSFSLLSIVLAVSTTTASAASKVMPTSRPTPIFSRQSAPALYVAPTATTVVSQGLSFQLLPKIRPYVSGHGVYIETYFTNSTRHFHSYDPRAIKWTVSGLSPSHDDIMRSRTKNFDHGDELFARNGLADIAPGNQASSSYDLADFVPISKSGTYFVKASLYVTDMHLTLSSAPITVTIAP